jgi:hypothetical protein
VFPCMAPFGWVARIWAAAAGDVGVIDDDHVPDHIGNMFPMSTESDSRTLGLDEAEAARLGPDHATRIRTFRLIVLLAQELRTLMDQLLRDDGLTTQQAALITVVEALGAPSLS